MSDLEFFGGGEQSEAFDPAAFERFKEKMAAAAAQLKAAQAQEQKQKQKEDELVKILLKFIQSGQKRSLMLLVARLLEQNVPASFIVAILLISNESIQEDLNIKLLPGPEQTQSNTKLPEVYIGATVLPLKIKIAMDHWAQQIYHLGREHAERVLTTVIDGNGAIKLAVVQLTTFSLKDFLNEKGIEVEYEAIRGFTELMLEKILTRIHSVLNTTKRLRDSSN